MDTYTILITLHIVGTILGVGGATMVEVAMNKALKDGQISGDEAAILKPTYTTIRVGLVLAILSGFGFLVIYKLSGQNFRLYDPVLWAKITVLLVILLNTALLQAHKINLYWGTALSFVSWWTTAFLGIFLSNGIHYSYFTILFVYTLTVILGAEFLHLIRKHTSKTV